MRSTEKLVISEPKEEILVPLSPSESAILATPEIRDTLLDERHCTSTSYLVTVPLIIRREIPVSELITATEMSEKEIIEELKPVMRMQELPEVYADYLASILKEWIKAELAARGLPSDERALRMILGYLVRLTKILLS